MRLIHYRIWHKKFNRWAKDSEVAFVHQQDTLENILDLTETDNFIFQLYTGIKDINGTKIYEGDIVKTHKNRCLGIIMGDEVEYSAGVITWLREGFCICQDYVGGSELSGYVSCYCHNSGLEIIGNIMESFEPCEQ